MSKVKDVLEAVLSYTVEAVSNLLQILVVCLVKLKWLLLLQGYDWRGVEIKNPFTASAECLLLFHLRGPNELNFPFKTTLPLEEDDDVSHIFDDISRDTLLRYPDGKNAFFFRCCYGTKNVISQVDGNFFFQYKNCRLVNHLIWNLKLSPIPIRAYRMK